MVGVLFLVFIFNAPRVASEIKKTFNRNALQDCLKKVTFYLLYRVFARHL